MKNTIINHLEKIQPSQIQTLLCEDMAEALYVLNNGLLQHKTVIHTWDQVPPHETIVQDTLQNLAEIALAMWPGWYGEEAPISDQASYDRLCATYANISTPWLRTALEACQANRLPLFTKLPRNPQLAQLALTIDPNNLTFVLAICDPEPLPNRLFSVAQLSTWLAQVTGARVAVLISPHLATHKELDSILYQAITVEAERMVIPETQPEEKERHNVWPIEGRPHPSSPGEQWLAAALVQDTELAELFQFNQRVETVLNTPYIVDLLWSVGRVVVEVDGYSYHRALIPFKTDRQRDYELLISGYVVLRLPHDEVMENVDATLEKIRSVVQFRRKQHE